MKPLMKLPLAFYAALLAGCGAQQKLSELQVQEVQSYTDIGPKELSNIYDSSVIVEVRQTRTKADLLEIILKTKILQGSGTVLCGNDVGERYVLTCAHVINSKLLDAEAIGITVNGLEAEIEKFDESLNLALLKADRGLGTCFSGKVAESEGYSPIAGHRPVVGFGFPHLKDKTLIMGLPVGEIPDPHLLRTRPILDEGVSGASVYDAEAPVLFEARLRGVIIGVMHDQSGKKSELGVMINAPEIRAFLAGTAVADKYL